MKRMLTVSSVLLSVALMIAESADATPVAPTGLLTDLGLYAAGTYTITGSGVVDLVGNGSFSMQPDGLPVSVVTAPNYSYFNPVGSFTADGSFGPAGANAKIGALIGTLSTTPVSAADWFLIGYQTQVTLNATQHIFASVNDTFYPNDTGLFDATVSAVPVPMAAWLLGSALAGLVGLGRKQRVS